MVADRDEFAGVVADILKDIELVVGDADREGNALGNAAVDAADLLDGCLDSVHLEVDACSAHLKCRFRPDGRRERKSPCSLSVRSRQENKNHSQKSAENLTFAPAFQQRNSQNETADTETLRLHRRHHRRRHLGRDIRLVEDSAQCRHDARRHLRHPLHPRLPLHGSAQPQAPLGQQPQTRAHVRCNRHQRRLALLPHREHGT